VHDGTRLLLVEERVWLVKPERISAVGVIAYR
jgi:hypothetical protein